MANPFTGLLTYQIGNLVINEYITALIALFVSFLGLCLFKRVVVSRLKRLAAKTENTLDDVVVEVVDSLGWPLYLVVSFYFAHYLVEIPAIINKMLGIFTMIVVTFYIMRALQRVVDFGMHHLIKKRKEEGVEGVAVLELFAKIAKLLLWAVAFLVVLSNLGYNVNTLMAGLGIGGIAIAFALQSVLADIFASISIYLDKPFHVGDTIQIGTDTGTVKQIGIKSTRLETLDGDELIVSNKELTESRVHNYKRMERRRSRFTLNVTYRTPLAKLKKIPGIIAGIIAKRESAELDRVHFKQLGDASLVFEVVYYVKNADYKDYMDTQQAINLAIFEAFQKERIEFAFPTQTVRLEKG